MSIEVTPVGVTCNLACTYCYEHPMRDAGNFTNGKAYDLDKMIAGLAREGGDFSIFGGEPLLTDIETLEALWKWGFEKYKKNAVQTNGTLITDKHIELFAKYNVSVGISLDGPAELNDTRWSGTVSETRRKTAMTLAAIDALIDAKRPPSLIITLHKLNASEDKLPRLQSWLKTLDEKGIGCCRLHVLQVDYDSVQETLGMTEDENADVMLKMAEFEKTCKNMSFDLFTDIKNILLGDDSAVTCTFNSCDPLSTDAVRGIDGQGNSVNCNRTNKEGFEFQKADMHGYERQLALYNTPTDVGGCKGCRFFVMCKGQCPGTGAKYDWRSKTALCQTYYRLFEYFEKEYLSRGVLPLSKNPLLNKIEQEMYNVWASGKQAQIKQSIFKVL